MASVGPTTPQTISQSLAPDTVPVPRSTSQSGYRTGDLNEGRQAVLSDLKKYLRVPYANLVESALAPGSDVSQVRRTLRKDVLDAVESTPPSRSRLTEGEAFRSLGDLISNIFEQVHGCSFAFAANPSKTPLSIRGNTSRPDAYVTRPHTGDTRWFDIAIPFEFKKERNAADKYDNERKMIWSLHNIMREDPLRRFTFGITVEDTDMRIWYSCRAFLAVSEHINFIREIDAVISLFYSIGSKADVSLGWDPTIRRILDKEDPKQFQYEIMIGGKCFTTIGDPFSTYGADAMVGRGTRVFRAKDENGNTVAIKDSWRDRDREHEGATLKRIFRDIRDKFGEEEATKAEKYFVRIQMYEDVLISEKPDATLTLTLENGGVTWIAVKTAAPLSTSLHRPSVGDIPDSGSTPSSMQRDPLQSDTIPCRIHTRTVFLDVGEPLHAVRCMADCFSCLSDGQQALYYLHKTNWVHRDFSVSNILWVKDGDRFIGKLTDVEYAKKVNCNKSHDVRTGTMHFMAVEVASQGYIFFPSSLGSASNSTTLDGSSPHSGLLSRFKNYMHTATSNANRVGLAEASTSTPPFRMNFLHDLESHWWAAMWILLYYTDLHSPTGNLEAQESWFDRAFPPAISSTQRLLFFNSTSFPCDALATLSETYKTQCRPIALLAGILKLAYQDVEKGYPEVSFNEEHVDVTHQIVNQTYSEVVANLNGTNIYLEPLHKALSRKKSRSESPTGRAVKKIRRE